jgi:adenosylmethionine-8-amino-7-oxononanoate aminotransferase
VKELQARDRACLWHPYTQHGLDAEPLAVAGAQGALLELADGRTLIDAISSWWATLHGHGHPAIAAAIARQAQALDHVLFAGVTHAPAVELAEALLAAAPPGLARVFFSDDGSTAVEAALKMAYQRWVHLGEPERSVFVALEGGYHGDTFGAMSVGDPDPFFRAYAPLLFSVRRVPPAAHALESALAELGRRACAVIVEPLVQGAAGMRMHPPDFLRAARAACDRHGVPLIADEVMTGFGRTGALFACGKAGITPDLLCLAKGLTGGTLPLAATLASAEIYAAFRSQDRARTFFHGHTFTASPIGCAAALASLRLIREEDTPEKLDLLGARIEAALADLRSHAQVRELRRTGGIVALELRPPAGTEAGYLSSLGPRLRAAAIELGVLLRPLGGVIYAMPPACTSAPEADLIASAMRALVDRVGTSS